MRSKLAKYRAKRDFTVTPEPSGEQAEPHAGLSFVIQQHAARRLHYDFRLELDGVLLSWAVPKGPSLSPGDKRLAVRVEDHPLDYADFEGVIPGGEYGGGTVVVWDRGTWLPEGDAHEALRKGRLTFALAGEKLRGTWHLIRTKPQGKQDSWLLFKGKDDAASTTIDVVVDKPQSVVSGRTLDEVAAAKDRVWHSHRTEPAPPAEIAALLEQLPLGFPLTNLEKVLYPEQGLTKAQLVAYLAVVADHMLPHVTERPLTLFRSPDGRAKQGFFQKKLAKGSPPPIAAVKLREESGELVDYMQIHDLPGLLGLAQLGTLEIHTWGCHTDKLERPDLIVLDLDPDPAVPFEQTSLAALALRKRLGDLGLDSWVKTTGGKGLHVVAPIERRLTWNDLKQLAKDVVDRMAADEPKHYTTNMAKAQRRGRIFLDYLRNGRGATFVAPYSPRARHGAPVALPITWEELARGIDPAAFTIASVPPRLASRPDPWADLVTTKQAISAAARRAAGQTRRSRAG